jgi:hypothetical protein
VHGNRQGTFTTIALERHEVGPDGAQLKRSFEVELMRGGPDFIALMLRVYAIETEAAELRATTISLRKGVDDSNHSMRGHEDSWNRPSQPDKKLQEELATASARCAILCGSYESLTQFFNVCHTSAIYSYRFYPVSCSLFFEVFSCLHAE